MARQPRLDLRGIPQHVIHRGDNRVRCLLNDGVIEMLFRWSIGISDVDNGLYLPAQKSPVRVSGEA